jgi:DNA-binding LacI/PurR family transcriptional regulator
LHINITYGAKKMKKKIKRPSIKDVGREAGVSISTVSSVINKNKFVSEEREKRVLEAIKKLKYRPNIIARGLRTKSTRAVGVILPDIAQPFFAQVIRGMEEATRKRGYTLVLGCSFYDIAEEERQINVLMNQFVDGIIFFCGYDSHDHIRMVYDSGIPVVVTDREIGNTLIPSVLIDNTLAMEMVIDYLAKLGHREIGYVSFSFDNQTTARKRYEGYLSGLKKNGLEYNQGQVIIDDSIRMNEFSGAYSVVKELLRKKSMPTAFATLADFLAIGLIKALKEMGYRIPEDISVMGFNNEIVSQFSEPPLTSVKQPKKLMGKMAMDLLLDMVEGKEIENKNIILPTEIIERGSAGPIEVKSNS